MFFDFPGGDCDCTGKCPKRCFYREGRGCNPPPPGLLQESLGPFGHKVFRECPSKCFWALECPKSVPRVSPECPDTFLTLRGHSRDTFWMLRSPGPEGPQNTPRDIPGTLRVQRARETPVAGRGGCKEKARKKQECQTHPLSGPLNRLNATLSLLHPLGRCRTPSAIGSAIGRHIREKI